VASRWSHPHGKTGAELVPSSWQPTFTAVPLLSEFFGGTPDTYHTAGLERGTATSSSTRPGTTSTCRAILLGCRAELFGDAVHGPHRAADLSRDSPPQMTDRRDNDFRTHC
jgi:hypothetical protein